MSLWLGQGYYWWIQIQIVVKQEVWKWQMGQLGWGHIYVFIWELVICKIGKTTAVAFWIWSFVMFSHVPTLL